MDVDDAVASEVFCMNRWETMRPKLLVVSPERNTWNQSHALFETEAVAHICSGQVDDHNFFFHEHSQEAVL